MFLYPTCLFGAGAGAGGADAPSSADVSKLSRSSFSVVRASPPLGGSGVESLAPSSVVLLAPLAAGDTERVLGGLTASESALEAVVLTLTLDPVRNSDAASRGRGADVVVVDWVAPSGLSLAASWLSDGNGIRGALDFLPAADVEEVVDDVVVDNTDGAGSPLIMMMLVGREQTIAVEPTQFGHHFVIIQGPASDVGSINLNGL